MKQRIHGTQELVRSFHSKIHPPLSEMAALLFLFLLLLPLTSQADGPEQLIPKMKYCLSMEECDSAKALIQMHDKATPSLHSCISGKNAELRFWCAGVLSVIQSPASVPPLIKMASHADIRSRAAAIFALGEFKDSRGFTVVLDAMNDSDMNVRFASTVALAKFKNPKAIPSLTKALQDEDYDVRSYAALSLGELGAQKSVSAIRQLLGDKNHQVRAFAAQSLSELGDQGAIKALTVLLTDRDWHVRGAAVFALANLRANTPEVLQALKICLNDSNKNVRENAAMALKQLSPGEGP
jgi:HEAT repeat protein